MKRTLILSLLIGMMGVMAFVGCERPETIEPNEGQPQQRAEDSLISQQGDTINYMDMSTNDYIHGKWHCEINDSTIIDLDIDTASNTFSAFSERLNEFSGLLMGYGSVEHYYMNGDTIFVTQIDNETLPQNAPYIWLVRRISHESMEMSYMNFLPQGGIIYRTNYLYNRY